MYTLNAWILTYECYRARPEEKKDGSCNSQEKAGNAIATTYTIKTMTSGVQRDGREVSGSMDTYRSVFT